MDVHSKPDARSWARAWRRGAARGKVWKRGLGGVSVCVYMYMYMYIYMCVGGWKGMKVTYSSLNSIADHALGINRFVTFDAVAAAIMLNSGVGSEREFAVEMRVSILLDSRRVVRAGTLV